MAQNSEKARIEEANVEAARRAAGASETRPSLPPDGTTRSRRRKSQRPGEILHAALRAFTRHGFVGCRMDFIAKEAGISKGGLYLYFDSKAALFKAVVHDIVAPAFEFERFERLSAERRRPAGVLLHEVLDYWAEKLSEPDLASSLRLLASDAQTLPELAAYCRNQVIFRGQRLIAGILSYGVVTQAFLPLDEALVAKALSAPFYLFGLWPTDDARKGYAKEDLRAAIKTCLELQIRGLTGRSDSRCAGPLRGLLLAQ